MLYQRIQAVFDDVKHYYYEMLDEYEYTEDYYQMNGEAVRYVRTVFDISRNKLANVIGTSPRTLGRFEDGVRTRLAVESIQQFTAFKPLAHRPKPRLARL